MAAKVQSADPATRALSLSLGLSLCLPDLALLRLLSECGSRALSQLQNWFCAQFLDQFRPNAGALRPSADQFELKSRRVRHAAALH